MKNLLILGAATLVALSSISFAAVKTSPTDVTLQPSLQKHIVLAAMCRDSRGRVMTDSRGRPINRC